MKHYWIRGLTLTIAGAILLGMAEPVHATSHTPPELMEEEWIENDDLLVPKTVDVVSDGAEISESTENIYGATETESLPESFDLRDVEGENYVTSVKNQGSSGLCWAYASLGACESTILKNGYTIEDDWLDSNGELTFSVGSLAWYAYTNRNIPGSSIQGDYITLSGKGYNGGNAAIACYALASGENLQLEQNAPLSRWSKGYSEYQRFVSYYRVANSDLIYAQDDTTVDTVKSWLMDTGAVMGSFYSKSTFYDNGNSSAYYQTKYSSKSANHAILIVGWDDNYAAENFSPSCRPSSDGAWLVRNSWGSDGAYGGYFWMSYEEPSLCELARFQVEERADNETLYQYDGAVSLTGTKAKYLANVYTAEKDGTITEVMIPNLSMNSSTGKCQISIYRLDAQSESPTDGTLLSQTTTTFNHYGYKGFSIKSTPVQEGEQFSVVISMSNAITGRYTPGTMYLPLESTNADAVVSRNCHISEGQSYIYDGDWYDIAEYRTMYDSYSTVGNAAIKVYVENTTTEVDTRQITLALEAGQPTKTSFNLYQSAYAVATKLLTSESYTQTEIDNAAGNLLAGLEQQGILSCAKYLYANEDIAFTLGDVDDNGAIELQDAFLALKEYAGISSGNLAEFDKRAFLASDLNESGKTDLNDAYQILTIYANSAAGNG